MVVNINSSTSRYLYHWVYNRILIYRILMGALPEIDMNFLSSSQIILHDGAFLR